jgi:hypothetical protein
MCQPCPAFDGIVRVPFDPAVYSFRRWFKEIFDIEAIELLHLGYPADVDNFVGLSNHLRGKCEERIDILDCMLHRFRDDVIVPMFGPIIAQQKHPTVRVYLEVSDRRLECERSTFDSLPRGEFLRMFYFDSKGCKNFHRDADYGVHRRAINLWLPVTSVSGTNTIWVGGTEGCGEDALPVELSFGSGMFFDGANRWHGTVWNTSGQTRVSFDWRFVPRDENDLARCLRATPSASGRAQTTRAVGGGRQREAFRYTVNVGPESVFKRLDCGR